MGDRATLEKIYVIMRRLLLIKLDGLNPIPRKGTTRHECYRALYEIQELLETRRYFGKHLPQTNADRIRAMSDEELANFLDRVEMGDIDYSKTFCDLCDGFYDCHDDCLLGWLRAEATI